MLYFLTIAFILAATVSSQSLADIPPCASTAALGSIKATTCEDVSNLQCICSDESFITSLLPKVKQACSAEDLQKTIDSTQKLCNSVGVSVNIPMASVATSTSTMTRNEAEATATTTTGGTQPAESNASPRPQSPESTAQPGSAAVRLQLYIARVASLVCTIGLLIA